ncbi:MAG: ABC transporter permease [Alphaproteobacteria bacterium]|nr:ABC transporter permease [Alphaproteobacteria bacterium]
MTAYVARRLLMLALTLLGVTTLLFLLRSQLGDPTLFLLPPDASEQARVELLRRLGLDRPLAEQYLAFIGHALRGDLGLSWRYNQPVLPLVLEALPATLMLAGAALGLGLACAIPLGVAAAVRRDSWVDTVASFVAVTGQAMPVYWSGLLLILLFSSTLRLLPSMGAEGWAALILPAATLGLNTMARIMRITRSAMLDVLGQDFVRMVRAKGLPETVVVIRHALRNAAVPIVALVGLQLGSLLGGAVLVETVFAWPGVGRVAVNAVYARDFPLVQAVALVVTVLFSVINLAVDLIAASLNPQIRLE